MPDFWEHENLSSLSIIWLISTIYKEKEKKQFWQNIWAKQESGLTTVWLKWDPPVWYMQPLDPSTPCPFQAKDFSPLDLQQTWLPIIPEIQMSLLSPVGLLASGNLTVAQPLYCVLLEVSISSKGQISSMLECDILKFK